MREEQAPLVQKKLDDFKATHTMLPVVDKSYVEVDGVFHPVMTICKDGVAYLMTPTREGFVLTVKPGNDGKPDLELCRKYEPVVKGASQ